ncbi:glycosyltransferase [Muricoccus radiodurans]|uniref:glycosyltransferase n=1 Tax=Muricoccus radiodurans TaxID=2231721 RepID=UPI003CEB6027
MQWALTGSLAGSYHRHWLTRFIPTTRHRFIDVHALYDHDRSRPSTSPREWLDYLRHAHRGLRVARLTRDPHVGLITVFPQLTLAAGLLKRALGHRLPILAWSFNLGRDFTGWRARLARAGLGAVDRIVVHSRREIESYAARFGLPGDRFVFVPFSVDVLNPEHAEEAERPFLLSMGSANRDYACLFEAVRSLDIPVVVVAGAHAVAGLDIPPNVELRAGLSLAACHVLAQRARLNVVPILNSFSASGQVTVIEAMMFGRCVVATNSIGTEDYVTDGENGVLVPPSDPAALRGAILELWNDASARARLGAAARRHALDHLTHEAAARRLEQLCDALGPGAG